MIPILYDQTEKEFKTNGIGRLSDAISCIVHERKNDAYELDLSYPVTGKYFNELKPGRIIFATHDNSQKPQPFDIVSVSSPSRGEVKVVAEHISRRLKGVLTKLNRLWFSTSDTVSLFFNDLNDKTENGYIIGACPFLFHTNITDAKSGYSPKQDAFTSVYDHLMDTQYGLLSVEHGAGTKGEYEFDVFDVHLNKERGTYNGIKMRTGKNVKTLTVDSNNKNVVTGVLAFWHGNDPMKGIDRTITISGDTASVLDKNDFGSTADILTSGVSLPYQKVVPLDLSSKFSYPPTIDQIRQEAQFYLDQQREFYMADSASYSIDLVYNSNNTAELQSADLCDWVMVEDVTLRVQKKLQVTEVWYDTLRNRYTSMSVGVLPKTFKQLVHKENKPVNQKADNVQAQVKDLAAKTDVENKVYPTGYDPKHPENWKNPGGALTDKDGNAVEQVATINRRPVFVKTVGGGGGSSCDLHLRMPFEDFVFEQAELQKVFTDYHDVKLCYKSETSATQKFIGSQVAQTIKRIVVSSPTSRMNNTSTFILKGNTWTTVVIHDVMLETTIKDGSSADMKFIGDLRLSMKKLGNEGNEVDVLIEQFTAIDEYCKGQICILTARVQSGFPFLPLKKMVSPVTPS